MAFDVPAAQNTPSPMASKNRTARLSRPTGLCRKNTTTVATSGTASHQVLRNAAGGIAPISTSRMTPPPSAVMVASTAIPTRSN